MSTRKQRVVLNEPSTLPCEAVRLQGGTCDATPAFDYMLEGWIDSLILCEACKPPPIDLDLLVARGTLRDMIGIPENVNPWFTSATGKKLYLFEPTPDQIDILDIAHALSNICRWGGHSLEFFSVADHCWAVSNLVPEEDALAALLHDATEAYLGDVITPLKRVLPSYELLERAWWECIADHFRISRELPRSVKVADRFMLECERRDLVNHAHKFEWEPDRLPIGPRIVPRSSIDARIAYLRRFAELNERR
jgi:hypothetical protein